MAEAELVSAEGAKVQIMVKPDLQIASSAIIKKKLCALVSS
jgi:hypothetical protein